MTDHSRRRFMQYSGAAVAGAAAAVAVAPTAIAGASTGGGDGTADDAAIDQAELAAAGTITMHVSDAASGEVLIMNGESEVTYRDPKLVAKLVRASRKSQA